MAPVNLSAPEWRVRQGQAVWQRNNGAFEVAGEIVAGTRSDQSAYVEFSKNGFPFLVARRESGSWQIDLPAQNRHFSGRGSGPTRLIALYLIDALAGKALPVDLSWSSNSDDQWKLRNQRTGESIEGYFSP